ncbi:MAG: heme exporter protein CcmB [Armatimonadetes bacterium]|nr:heme exporter protein CcmB [Armatimonadota bacterium]
MPRTNSIWAETQAIFQKEITSELRNSTGFWSAALFALTTVSAIGFASAREKPGPELAAGILTAVLLFSGVSSLPRSLLVEDEQGTLELLRLRFEPESIYYGKLLFVTAMQFINSFVLCMLYIAFAGLSVVHPGILALGLVAESVAISGAVVLCGAVVMGATSRWLLVGVLSMPFLLPQSAACIGVLRYGFGAGFSETAWINIGSLFGFGLLGIAIGPPLARALWKRP